MGFITFTVNKKGGRQGEVERIRREAAVSLEWKLMVVIAQYTVGLNSTGIQHLLML